MKAIILAAGRGSRMGHLTDEVPKCLVKYKGKALLDWQIEALKANGFSEIGIVTGYRRELLTNRGLIEFHNERWADTNMVSSLATAHDWLRNDQCVISYSDLFYQKDAITLLKESSADLSITYDVNWRSLWEKRFGDPLLDAETFKINKENEVTEIGRKPTSVDEIQGQYMGLLKFTPSSWAEVERIRMNLDVRERDKIHMTGTLQKIIDAGHIKVKAVPFSGEWSEFDSITDLQQAESSMK